MMWSKINIKQKLLIAFFLISIIPILIVGIFSYLYSNSETEKMVGFYFSESVEQVVKNIDFLLRRIEEDSVQVASLPEIQKALIRYNDVNVLQKEEFKRGITAVIRNIYNSRKDMVNIEIMASDYSLLIPASLEESLIDARNYRQSQLFQKALEADGAPVWLGGRVRKQSEGKIWSVSNKTIIEFSRCIKNYMNMQKLGVIAIEIKESSIEDYYKKLISDDEEMAFIINNDGIIISHPDKSMIGKLCDPGFFNKIGKNGSSRYFSSMIGGSKMLVSYYDSEVTGWKLFRAIPYNKITKQSRNIGYTTLVVAVIFIFIAFVLSIIVSFSISKPISGIVKAMYRVKEGDLTAKVKVKNRDEIGFLGDNFNEMVKRIDELFKGIKDEEKKKREAEFRALQAQISPHFLFNILNSLKFFTYEKGQKEIANIVGYLVELLRSSFSLKEFITIEEEIKLVKNFIWVQEFRFNTPININYDIDESVLNCKILKFLLQPLVENSLIHGIDVFSGNGHIELTIKKQNDDILIKVVDNGKGMDESQLGKYRFSGFALNNTEERIKLFFGDKYGMNIKSEPGKGVDIEILIPTMQ